MSPYAAEHLEHIPSQHYQGCEPGDHELETKRGQVKRCRICGYHSHSLINWWGQPKELVHG